MMRKIIQYRFSSTIALISGATKFDSQLQKIAKTLQTVSNKQVSFVGVAGSENKELFSKVYASSALLDNQQFQVTRAYNTYHEVFQDCPIMPYRAYTHFKNYQMIKHLQKSNFFNDVFDNKISAVATIGNFSLASRIGQKLNEYALRHNAVKPYSVFFHRQASERTIQNEELVDFQYYNVEKALTNGSMYRFPSLCVGYDGLYRAFQYLQQFKQQSSEDVFWNENFSYEVSELVTKARSSYRKSKGISEDKYIIYIDAGETVEEIKFSFKAFKNGLKNFFDRSSIKSISTDHFEFFVFSPNNEKLKAEIQGKLGFLPNNIKVTIIEQQDKYAALSASDFGMLHNGDSTVEAAAVQLPSLVVDNRSNVHAYFNNLYNGHASPLNIATNYEAYQDLCGSFTAIAQKLGTNLLKHFQNPKYRYYYAKLYRDQIQRILSKSGLNPHLKVSQTGLETGCKHLFAKAELLNNVQTASELRKRSNRKSTFAI